MKKKKDRNLEISKYHCTQKRILSTRIFTRKIWYIMQIKNKGKDYMYLFMFKLLKFRIIKLYTLDINQHLYQEIWGEDR